MCQVDTAGMDVDGRSLVPLIEGKTDKSPHDVLHFDFEKQWAVRYGDWKLLSNAIDVKPNDKNDVIEGLMLTNLKMDSTEMTDYKNEHPDVVEKLMELRQIYEKRCDKN